MTLPRRGRTHKGLNPLPQRSQGVKVPEPPPPTSTGVAPTRAPSSLGRAGASSEDRQTHLPFGSMLCSALLRSSSLPPSSPSRQLLFRLLPRLPLPTCLATCQLPTAASQLSAPLLYRSLAAAHAHAGWGPHCRTLGLVVPIFRARRYTRRATQPMPDRVGSVSQAASLHRLSLFGKT